MIDRPPALSRRAALGLGAVGAVGIAAAASPSARADAAPTSWRALEQRYDVRIGLAARNLRTGRSLTHRPDERFPIMSVFKMIAVAAVLDRRSGRDLGRRVPYGREDLVENAPITSVPRQELGT